MFNESRRNLIPFLILGLFQAYLLAKGFYSISADEAGHTLDALAFYNGSSLFGIWLPFQKMFLGIFLFDLFWMPRIVSMILGHLTLLVLMLISQKIFKESLYTGILGALSLIAVFSVLPLAEIYFLFFLLLSIYLLLKESNWVILSTIILTSVRFEGWIFALIIGIVLYQRIGLKALIVLIFPLFWVLLSYFETGSLLGFITQVSARKRVFTAEDSVLYNFLLISIYSLSLLGIFYLGKNKIYALIFISTLIIWTLATSLSGAMATHNVWRVGLVWNVLLIPFTAYFITRIKYKVVVLAVIGYLFFAQSIDHSKESYTKPEDLQAGKVISNLEGKFIMPRYGWEYSNLLVTSGKEIVFKDSLYYADTKGYDYIILMQEVNLPLIYENKKWRIYENSIH